MDVDVSKPKALSSGMVDRSRVDSTVRCDEIMVDHAGDVEGTPRRGTFFTSAGSNIVNSNRFSCVFNAYPSFLAEGYKPSSMSCCWTSAVALSLVQKT